MKLVYVRDFPVYVFKTGAGCEVRRFISKKPLWERRDGDVWETVHDYRDLEAGYVEWREERCSECNF